VYGGFNLSFNSVICYTIVAISLEKAEIVKESIINMVIKNNIILFFETIFYSPMF